MSAEGAQLPRNDVEFDHLILAERRRTQRRDATVAALLSLAFLLAFLGTWELIHATGLIKPIFVSDPRSVVAALIVLLAKAATWHAVWATFFAALCGLALGALLGIVSGILMARIPVLWRAFHPYLTIFNAFPRPALAPIFILWFGLGALPKITVAVTIVFFVLLLNTMAGIGSVAADVAFLSRALGMTTWQRFRLVELPHAMPTIVAGLRLGAVYAVLGRSLGNRRSQRGARPIIGSIHESVFDRRILRRARAHGGLGHRSRFWGLADPATPVVASE
jgi:NitT/TauT family transport system permease protein